MASRDLSFVHRFEPAKEPATPPLLMLHGTGGDETDLLPLGRMIAPRSALLSPRGKVLENGVPRFFRRFAEGVFDEDDVRRRADELADFVEEAGANYGIEAPIAVGYSNGANIAAAVLLERPNVLTGAILLRAMDPFARPPKPDLAGKPVLLISGRRDRVISANRAARLAMTLTEAGAAVIHETLQAGHELSQTDADLARSWFDALTKRSL